jgi:hypothetical protein
MRRIISFIAFLLLTVPVFGQDYKYVNAETLNIREEAGKQYNIAGQVRKGDKVTAIAKIGSWTQIKTESGTTGFVLTSFLSSARDLEGLKKGGEQLELGFQYGFKKAFSLFFLVIVLIFAGIEYYRSKRIKDARYLKGYREIPFTPFEVIKFSFYSVFFCSLIGVVMGIFYWIKSL